MKDKPITNLNELEDFTINIIYALREISRVEAEIAIRKAFQEFKESFLESIKKLADK